MKILVVDDDQGSVNALKACLMSGGYQIITAINGLEALKEINQSIEQSEPVGLMVTDLIMPEVNGMDLIQSARKLLPELSAVLVTAYGVNQVREHIMKLGNCSYLEKPFNPEVLMEMISKIENLS